MEEVRSIEDLVVEETARVYERMQELDPTDEEYIKLNHEFMELSKRASDMAKFNIEREDKLAAQETEVELKEREMKNENIDRVMKHSVTVFGTISSLCAYAWCANKSWKFEETGTVCNTPGRNALSKLMNLFHK